MRLIDADHLKTKMQSWYNVTDKYGDHNVYNFVWEGDINDEPTVDAVPIVHCKDCIHRPIVMNSFGDICNPVINHRQDFTCPALREGFMNAKMPADDFFCAYGKKSTDFLKEMNG